MYNQIHKFSCTTRLFTFGIQYFQLHSLASWSCVRGGGGDGYRKIFNVCFKRLNSLLVRSATKCLSSSSSSSSLPLNQMQTKRFNSTLILIYRNDKFFYMDFPGRGRATIKYELVPHLRIFVIHHTNVPEALKGTGVGKKLAEVALKYADENNYFVHVKCDFVKHYIQKYEPKYKALLI